MPALTSLLVRDAVVSILKIEEALQLQVLEGGDIDTVLLELNAVDENVLNAYRAALFNLPPASRHELMSVGPETLKTVPSEIAEELRLVPISLQEGVLVIALSTPVSEEKVKDLSKKLGYELEFRIATAVRIEAALAVHFGIPISGRMRLLAEQLEDRDPGVLPTVISTVEQEVEQLDEGFFEELGSELLSDDDTEEEKEEERTKTDAASGPEPLSAEWLEEEKSEKRSSSNLLDGRTLQGTHRVDIQRSQEGEAPGGFIDRGTMKGLINVRPRAPIDVPSAQLSVSEIEEKSRTSQAEISDTQTRTESITPEKHSKPPHHIHHHYRGPLLLDKARELLLNAKDRDEIVEIFFTFSRQYFDCAALFNIRKEVAIGIIAFGFQGAADISEYIIPLVQGSSLVDLKQSARARVTDLSRREEDIGLPTELGRLQMQPAVLIPICIKKRAVLFLYGDRSGEHFTIEEVADLIEILPSVSRALQRVIQARKILASGAKLGGTAPSTSTKRSDTQSYVKTPELTEAIKQSSTVQVMDTIRSPGSSAVRTKTKTLGGIREKKKDAGNDSSAQTRGPRVKTLGGLTSRPPISEHKKPRPIRETEPRIPSADHREVVGKKPVAEPDLSKTLAGFGTKKIKIETKSDQVRNRDLTKTLAGVPKQQPDSQASQHKDALSVLGVRKDKSAPPPPAGKRSVSQVEQKPKSISTAVKEMSPSSDTELKQAKPAAAADNRSTPLPQREASDVGFNTKREVSAEKVSPPVQDKDPDRRKGEVSVSSSDPRVENDGSRVMQEVVKLPKIPIDAISQPPEAQADDQSERESAPTDSGIQERSVIVDMGDEVSELVDRLLEVGPDDDGPIITALLRAGEAALPVLAQRFPGPLWFDRNLPHQDLPSGRDVSAITRAMYAFHEKALPHIRSLLTSQNADVRFYATLMAADLPHVTLLEPLGERLFDIDEQIRNVAVQVLQQYRTVPGFDHGLQSLRAVVTNSTYPQQTRLVAIEALAGFRDTGCFDTMLRMLTDNDKRLADAARQAMMVITAQDFVYSVRKWYAWIKRNQNRERTEWLIDSLMHDNQALRTATITELQRLTQQYYDYNPLASKRDRERIQKQYRKWWEQQSKKGK